MVKLLQDHSLVHVVGVAMSFLDHFDGSGDFGAFFRMSDEDLAIGSFAYFLL